MQLLRRLYGKLHLRINESKSAVASVFTGRKFLGFSFWMAPKGVVRRKVARKVAANGRRWWHNSAMLLNSVLTLSWFDSLGLPRLASS